MKLPKTATTNPILDTCPQSITLQNIKIKDFANEKEQGV